MFKFLSQFTFKGNTYFLYKRASKLYYSSKSLGKEIESSNELSPIESNVKLTDFLVSINFKLPLENITDEDLFPQSEPPNPLRD